MSARWRVVQWYPPLNEVKPSSVDNAARMFGGGKLRVVTTATKPLSSSCTIPFHRKGFGRLTMNRLLTVGYDGSAPSRRAVLWSLTEAKRRGADVKVVACYSITPMADPWGMTLIPNEFEVIAKSVTGDVEKLLAEMTPMATGINLTSKVVAGSAATLLVEESEGSDLLIIGTTGHGDAEGLFLGSVAHAVSRTCGCPVVLVPDQELRPLLGRIVVGVDGSPSSDEALIWATDECDMRDAELLIVHAWTYAYGTELGSPQGRDLTMIDAAQLLEAAAASSRERGRSRTETELVEDGPINALVDRSDDADLIVIGTRGRGGLRSLLFGSVAHGVARHAWCPTVVLCAKAETE